MSRFVSGGTIGEGTSSSAPAPADSGPDDKAKSAKAAEWQAVQAELDAERQRREEHRRKVAEGGDKSLYEVLQENKAAKQAAFEEQNKVRNQFRALDDDEVEFLDEVRQKKRDEELRARRETEEGLRAFKRQQQREAEAEAGGDAVGTEDWGVAGGRKRRRGHQGGIKGLKRRETSEGKAEEAKTEAKAVTDKAEAKTDTTAKTEAKAEAKAEKTPEKEAPNAKPKLGLVDYGSDSDSE